MQYISPILPTPLGYRKNIPLYYPKTEEEIKADRYEIYNPNVLRSCRNFYEGDYGKKLLAEISPFLPEAEGKVVVELGCGSGYLLGNIAEQKPSFECIGLDYSYQMLKMAAEVFKNEHSTVTPNRALQNGMEDMDIPSRNLPNITFALSDACVTPLPDASVDFCFSCFLWDRVGDASKLLQEKMRIVKPGGKILIISPFNYLSKSGWDRWHPLQKVIDHAEQEGLAHIHQNHFTLEKFLDIRGNRVVWEVDSLVFEKVASSA